MMDEELESKVTVWESNAKRRKIPLPVRHRTGRAWDIPRGCGVLQRSAGRRRAAVDLGARKRFTGVGLVLGPS